jgi:mannose/fructose-specific phosphotransferase system component IIA
MKRVLIATHGYLADGYRSSIELLIGKQECLSCIDAYVDESDYTQRIREFVDSVSDDDQGIIFTDLYGGSVFQKVVLTYPEALGLYHVTGMNLALVLEVLLSDQALTQKALEQSIETARQSMQLMKPVSEGTASGMDDSDDFLS